MRDAGVSPRGEDVSDESVRSTLRTAAEAEPGPRRMVPVSTPAALELLASVPFGRIVFTQRALPAIRVLNHAVVDGRIVLCTHEGATLATVTGGDQLSAGVVVAYEADAIDPQGRLGWSVVVTGHARLLVGTEAERMRSAVPLPWFGGVMDQVVCLEPELVSGMRLLAAR